MSKASRITMTILKKEKCEGFMLLHIKTCHMVVEIHGIGAKAYEQTTRKEQNPEKTKQAVKKNLIHTFCQWI